MATSAPADLVRRLPPRRRRFVEEYVKDLNGTRAAIRAGYSPRTANEQAAQLLATLSVSQAVEARLAKLTEANEITADRIIRELALIGFANMQDYITIQGGDAFVDLSKLTRDQAAAIGEVTSEDFLDGRGEDARQVRRVKIKLIDKVSALVKLGQRLRMFEETPPTPPAINFHFNMPPVLAKPTISSKPRRGGVEILPP